MSSSTKKAIVASFLKLISKKPFDKITVRDIVDDCGINRNTFYYYFQDIYAVLEEICQVAIDYLPKDASLPETLCAFFKAISTLCMRYPRAARGLALSFGFEGMERYFKKELDCVILACVARDPRLVSLTPSQQQIATLFLRHAIIGFCLDFMRDPRSDDPVELQSAIGAVLQLFLNQDAAF